MCWMMRRWMAGIVFLLVIMIVQVPVSAGRQEDRIVDNKKQDVLFAGKVSHVSRDYIVLKVTDYINVQLNDVSIEKREADHRYVISKDGAIAYRWSYHEKETVEEGDCIVASLRKKNDRWSISNGIFEVDSDNYKTLSFEPYQQDIDVSKLSLKYFINSDGEMKDFSSKSNGSKIYYEKKKIFDARWKLKKYLTVEEIRNSEKIKAMDQKAHVTERKSNISSESGIKRKVLFVVDILLIVGLVAILRKRSHTAKKTGSR